MSTATFIPDMLRTLADVSIVAPSSGQALLHNGTLWQNRAITTDDVSGLSGMLASYATKTGGNSLSGDQSLASGSSFLATNGGDWPGVAMTGTGLVGKDTSNATTWSIASETGVITGVGSALTALNGSNVSTGTIANARTTATSANTASAIVARNGSGDFTARIPLFMGDRINFANTNIIVTSSTDITLNNYSGGSGGGSVINAWQNGSSGIRNGLAVNATDSSTGTGGLVALNVNMPGTGTGTGSKILIRGQKAGVDKFSVDSAGLLTLTPTNPTSAFSIVGTDATISLNGRILRSATGGSLGNALYTPDKLAVGSVLLVNTTANDGVNALQVAGSAAISTNLFLGNTTDPSTPVLGGRIYTKSGGLYFIGSSGTITPLAAA